MNLYVGNLDYTIREEQLKELFEQVGEVVSVKIITDKMTGRSKGFAFVEMGDVQAGQQAIAQLNGKALKNRDITVTEARPKPEGQSRPNNRYNKY